MKRLLASTAFLAMALSLQFITRTQAATVYLKNNAPVCIRFDALARERVPIDISHPEPIDVMQPPMFRQVGPTHQAVAAPGRSIEISSDLFAKGVEVHAYHGRASDCAAGFLNSATQWRGSGLSGPLHLSLHEFEPGGPFSFRQP